MSLYRFLSIISAVPNIEQESGINFSNRLFIDRFNEEMIESLFGCHSTAKKDADGKKDSAVKDATQLVRILEAKKAQNLAISLKALSVSAEEVRNAAMEGKTCQCTACTFNQIYSDLLHSFDV
jgi:hypothetical protein